ncbi:MAG: molybdenum cofactor biosynthesis protein [Peptococcaceae bacterium]|nr:molybdenum cofactor biosynthesis protein [Peptococcaceae bacterium]
MGGRVVAVCTSRNKGEQKNDVGEAFLQENHGIVGDAHAGPWHRQVSLLAVESINKMREKGLNVKPGDFAENLTVEGMELHTLPVGTLLQIGPEVIGEVSQIGKKCHTGCAVFQKVGDCIMPREGIFIKVKKSGTVRKGDHIEVIGQVYRVAVVTVSDTGAQGKRVDEAGQAVKDIVRGWGWEVTQSKVISDDIEVIVETLVALCDEDVDLILTTGGTGFSPRDNTPEATSAIVERPVPGLAEVMRYETSKITPRAWLSRGVAGIRKRTLIVNLPGSPKAVQECLDVLASILPHGLEILSGRAKECARAGKEDNS